MSAKVPFSKTQKRLIEEKEYRKLFTFKKLEPVTFCAPMINPCCSIIFNIFTFSFLAGVPSSVQVRPGLIRGNQLWSISSIFSRMLRKRPLQERETTVTLFLPVVEYRLIYRWRWMQDLRYLNRLYSCFFEKGNAFNTIVRPQGDSQSSNTECSLSGNSAGNLKVKVAMLEMHDNISTLSVMADKGIIMKYRIDPSLTFQSIKWRLRCGDCPKLSKAFCNDCSTSAKLHPFNTTTLFSPSSRLLRHICEEQRETGIGKIHGPQ